MKILILVLIGTLIAPWQAMGSHGFSLDGISHEPENSEQSIAIINGDILHVGEKSGHYALLEIRPNSIRVRDTESGETKEFKVGDRVSPKKEAEILENTAGAPPKGSRPSKKKPTAIQQVFKAIGRIQYTGVLMELKQIHTSALFEYYDGGYRSLTVGDLVKAGHLSQVLADGKNNGYQYRIDITNHGPQVHANPIEPTPTARFFLIDSHGYVFTEIGKEATTDSEPYSL